MFTRTHTQPYKSDTKKSIQLALLIRPLPFLHSCGAVVMEACWVGIGNTLSLSPVEPERDGREGQNPRCYFLVATGELSRRRSFRPLAESAE